MSISLTQKAALRSGLFFMVVNDGSLKQLKIIHYEKSHHYFDPGTLP